MRSPVTWYGGKGRLVKRMRQYIPWTKCYFEPYAGGASVLFDIKPRSVEAINDLDQRIVRLFRALQSDRFDELRHKVEWTLYSVEEFDQAIGIIRDGSDDEVEFAWAAFVTLNQGISGMAKTRGNWSRVFVSRRQRAETTSRWQARQSMLSLFRDRLMRVQIDSRDALDFIRYWDCPEGCFYVDPPYVHDTRESTNVYHQEPNDDHHRELVEILQTCQAAVVLSGYEHDIYAPLGNWKMIRIDTACHAACRGRNSGLQGEGAATAKVPRTETLWLNERAERLVFGAQQRRLFELT